MGISFSHGDQYASSPSLMANTGLGDLPEGCVALVLTHIDPSEICSLARMNRTFRGASWADFVWESKLPSNYRILSQKLFGDLPKTLDRREIYAKLCRINTLDGGTKKAWLDKSTGGVCLSISSKGLSITGIDDRRYWNHIPTEESRTWEQLLLKKCINAILVKSARLTTPVQKKARLTSSASDNPRYSTVAYLQQIWWFEVDGEVEFPLPAGTYSLFFKLQMGRAGRRFGRRICNTEHVHGWDIKPVQFQLWTGDGQYAISKCFLNEPGKWIDYHVGDFVVDNTNSWTKIKFSMTQIDCTHTKGGICLDSAVIYPSGYREGLKHL